MCEKIFLQGVEFKHLFKVKLDQLFKIYSDQVDVHIYFDRIREVRDYCIVDFTVYVAKSYCFQYSFILDPVTLSKVSKNDTIEDYDWEKLTNESFAQEVVYSVKSKNIGDVILQNI